MDMSTGVPRPDWVMCGNPNPSGGVRLIASKELNQAELRAEVSRRDLDAFYGFAVPMGPRYFLTAEMRTFTVIDAADYPAAFKALFEDWSPEPVARAAIGEGQQELGSPYMAEEGTTA